MFNTLIKGQNMAGLTKRLIIITVTIVSILQFSQVSIAESKQKQSINQIPYSLNTKKIIKFYSPDILGLMYLQATPEHLDQLKDFVNKYIHPIKDQDYQIIRNISLAYGPDLTTGFLFPEDLKEGPSFVFIFEIQKKEFNIESLTVLFSNKQTTSKQSYKTGTIYSSGKDKTFLGQIDNYIIYCESESTMKKLMDNYLSNAPSILDVSEAKKALTYLSEDNDVIGISNNSRCSSYFRQLEELKNKEPAQSKTQAQDIQDKTSDQEQTPLSEKPNSISDNTKTSPIDIFTNYQNAFEKTNSFSAIGLNLNNNNINVSIYTPYTLDFIAPDKSKLEGAIESFLTSNKDMNIAEILPVETTGYLSIANLGQISNILSNIENPELQKGLNEGKLLILAMTGLDLEKQLIPVLADELSVAMIQNDKDQAYTGILTAKNNNISVFDQLMISVVKIFPKIELQTELINNNNFKKIVFQDPKFEIYYGNLKNKIFFGQKDLINKVSSPIEPCILNSDKFKPFLEIAQKPANLKFYLNFSKLFENNNSFIADFPKEVKERLQALFINISNFPEQVFNVDIIINLNPKQPVTQAN